jgi:hypothetical protein
VRQRAVSAEEEAEFDKELRTMMQESIDARKFEVRKGAALELAMPINIGAQVRGATRWGSTSGFPRVQAWPKKIDVQTSFLPGAFEIGDVTC